MSILPVPDPRLTFPDSWPLTPDSCAAGPCVRYSSGIGARSAGGGADMSMPPGVPGVVSGCRAEAGWDGAVGATAEALLEAGVAGDWTGALPV
jgi:hypothetical protein